MHPLTVAYVFYIDKGLPVPPEVQDAAIEAGASPAHFLNPNH